jgi:plasmid stabilization system protein ParE
MTYRVSVSEPAERDADVIYAWLNQRSPQGAGRWWKAFLAALEKLQEHAGGLALAPEADHFDEPLRQVLFKTRRGRTYRAMFVIRGRIVHVLRVRGAGQDRVGRDEIELPD